MSCRIAQISLRDERFSRFRVYGELFVYLLHTYSMLSLGLYRSYQWTNKGKSSKQRDNQNEDRYVTTAPSYDAKLRPNDKVFVLAQSEMELPFPLELEKTDMDGSDDEDASPPPVRKKRSSDVSLPISVDEVQSDIKHNTLQRETCLNNTSENAYPKSEEDKNLDDLPAVYTTDNSSDHLNSLTKDSDVSHLIA